LETKGAPNIPSNARRALLTETIQEVFLAESTEQLDELSNLLVDLEDRPGDEELIEQLQRAAHNLKGAAGTVGRTAFAKLLHTIEDVTQLFYGGERPELFNRLFSAVDVLRGSLGSIAAGKDEAQQLEEAEQQLRSWLLSETQLDDIPFRASHPPNTATDAPELRLGEYDAVRVKAMREQGEVLYRLSLRLLRRPNENFAVAAQKVVQRLREVGDVVLTAPRDSEWEQLGEERYLLVQFGGGASPESALDGLRGKVLEDYKVDRWTDGCQPAVPEPKPTMIRSVPQHSVRVGVMAMDNLVDLIGELVIVESMIVNATQKNGESAPWLSQHVNDLTRITRELQDNGMRLRMVPLRGTFRAMGRIVRDFGQKYDRSIRLEIHGDDTEIDRSMVERLSDPLVHLIRNAIDHGIEPADKRRAAGKPGYGTVTLSARQQGGSIVIEVSDDGRGLDREAILSKARQAGLIADGSNLTEHEILDLVLTPGFSTAATVTDLSGRGVGLDVVRRNIEVMRGSLTVDSQPGQGTTFRLSLPITLAIIDGMLVSCGEERYILPTRSIVESVQPREEMLLTQAGALRMLRIRGEIMPLISLSRIFDIPEATQSPTDALVVILESAASRVGLIVDDVIAQQQVVIKSIGRGIPESRFLSGAAILPDGQVGLILNVEELIKLLPNSAGGQAQAYPSGSSERKENERTVSD
jgi:two-component system chemotaxis sensor kinase CheA